MKSKAIVPIIVGIITGIITYIILLFIEKSVALWAALIAFAAVALFLYTYILIGTSIEDKITTEFESELETKANIIKKFSAIMTLEDKSIEESRIYICTSEIIIMIIRHNKPEVVSLERREIGLLELRQDLRVALGTEKLGKIVFLLSEYDEFFEQLKAWMGKPSE